MSRHLSDAALADALDGRADTVARGHLAGCEGCALRLAEAEAGLALARRDEVPEPSPLYWEALRRNVGRRIEAEPRRRLAVGWLVPFAGAAAVALVVVSTGRLPRPAVGPTASPAVAADSAVLEAWSPLPAPEADEDLVVLEGLSVTANGLPAWDEGKGVDAYLAGLTDDESAALVDALARRDGKERL
jgi:hypothetical protein